MFIITLNDIVSLIIIGAFILWIIVVFIHCGIETIKQKIKNKKINKEDK